MDRPKRLRIGYLDYKVVRMPKKRQAKLDGQHLPNKGQIELADGLMPAHEANTLLHEVLHAVLHAAGAAVNEKTEEPMVLMLANGLCKVIQDNPEFLPFLIERLADGRPA